MRKRLNLRDLHSVVGHRAWNIDELVKVARQIAAHFRSRKHALIGSRGRAASSLKYNIITSDQATTVSKFPEPASLLSLKEILWIRYSYPDVVC